MWAGKDAPILVSKVMIEKAISFCYNLFIQLVRPLTNFRIKSGEAL